MRCSSCKLKSSFSSSWLTGSTATSLSSFRSIASYSCLICSSERRRVHNRRVVRLTSLDDALGSSFGRVCIECHSRVDILYNHDSFDQCEPRPCGPCSGVPDPWVIEPESPRIACFLACSEPGSVPNHTNADSVLIRGDHLIVTHAVAW